MPAPARRRTRRRGDDGSSARGHIDRAAALAEEGLALARRLGAPRRGRPGGQRLGQYRLYTRPTPGIGGVVRGSRSRSDAAAGVRSVLNGLTNLALALTVVGDLTERADVVGRGAGAEQGSAGRILGGGRPRPSGTARTDHRGNLERPLPIMRQPWTCWKAAMPGWWRACCGTPPMSPARMGDCPVAARTCRPACAGDGPGWNGGASRSAWRRSPKSRVMTGRHEPALQPLRGGGIASPGNRHPRYVALPGAPRRCPGRWPARAWAKAAVSSGVRDRTRDAAGRCR